MNQGQPHMSEGRILDGRERVPVAVIGLGEAAWRILLPALTGLENVSVVSACDPDEAARERVARAGRIPRLYADPIAMLTAERPQIAVVATPPFTHAQLCLQAIESNCHVFCEKPFTASLEEADEVIAAAREKGRVVAVNNQYYQMPIYRAVKALIEGGQVGSLYHINVWQQIYLLPETEGGWKAALESKRVLYEFGTHVVDLLCYFFGASPTSVSARIPRIRPGVEGDVLVVMRLDFPGERIASVAINRMSHAPRRYLEMRLDCEGASFRISYGGLARLDLGWNSQASRPRFRLSLTQGGEARLERDGRSRLLVKQPANAISLASRAHFDQFLSAVAQGGDPPVSASHAREVLRAVLAGYRSAAEGGSLMDLTKE
jgi:predicted dehydrogenase